MAQIISSFEAIIFDMDGVLLDSEAIYRQASIEAASELGFKMSEKIYRATIGVPDNIARKIIRTNMGEEFPFLQFEQLWGEWVEEKMRQNVPLKQGAKQILELIQKNNIPMAIATSTSNNRASQYLKKAQIDKFFQTIISGDDVINGKPHPEPFLKAAAKLGVNPKNSIAVEDSYNGVRAAHRAGMKTIMIPDILPPNEEMKRLSHAILQSISSLAKVCNL